MSVKNEGKQICCDGEGCRAVSLLPIALHPVLLPPDHRSPMAEGWLFMNSNDAIRHFCPLCALIQLDQIARNSGLEKSSL